MSLLHEIRTQNQLGDIKAELEERNRIFREQQENLSYGDNELDPRLEWYIENRATILLPYIQEYMIDKAREFAKTASDVKSVKKYIDSLREDINNAWVSFLGEDPISRRFATELKRTVYATPSTKKSSKNHQKS